MQSGSRMYRVGATHSGGSGYSIGLSTGPRASQALLSEIAGLKARIEALESAFEVVEEMDWAEALAKSREIFSAHKVPLSAVELADALGTSYSQAIEICGILEGAGEIVHKENTEEN